MRRFFLSIVLPATFIVATGCGGPSLPTEKPKASEGTARPRPGEDGKVGKSDVPKGMMKPIAD